MKKKVHSVGGYLLYSLGAIPSVLPYNMIQSFFVLFYGNVLGLGSNLTGSMLIIYGIWNAINDPIIGIWMDKKKTRWGRRIPYIIVGTIPMNQKKFDDMQITLKKLHAERKEKLSE
ncbi:MAG: MFS transporter [Promethearchaeota archaeon]